MEIWKDVIGYEGLYQVSNLGNVKSLNYNNSNLEKNLIGGFSNGYRQVGLNGIVKTKRVKVHRLVAQAFIPNPENKPQVNHINGKKDDNRVDNLEWATAKENSIHSYENNLSKPKIGIESHLFGKRGDDSIRAKKVINIETNEVFLSVLSASKSIGKSYDTVVKQLNGNRENKTKLRYL